MARKLPPLVADNPILRRALSTITAAREIYRISIRYGDSGQGRKQTIRSVPRVRRMDNQIMEKDKKPRATSKTMRERIRNSAALHLAGRKNFQIDEILDYGEGTTARYRSTHFDIWREELMEVVDRAWDEVQRGRMKVSGRLLSSAPIATEVLYCAMVGEEFPLKAENEQERKPVSKDMKLAAEGTLKMLHLYCEAGGIEALEKPADLTDHEEAFESAAEDSKLDSLLTKKTNSLGETGTN